MWGREKWEGGGGDVHRRWVVCDQGVGVAVCDGAVRGGCEPVCILERGRGCCVVERDGGRLLVVVIKPMGFVCESCQQV